MILEQKPLKKAYIINFDTNDATYDYNKFHEILTSKKSVVNWWHYLESSYIVVTEGDVTASHISNFIMQQMPGKLYFVCELNLINHNGWLPQEAWDWINEYNRSGYR